MGGRGAQARQACSRGPRSMGALASRAHPPHDQRVGIWLKWLLSSVFFLRLAASAAAAAAAALLLLLLRPPCRMGGEVAWGEVTRGSSRRLGLSHKRF